MNQFDDNVEDFQSRDKADHRTYVRFFMDAVQDQAASVREGRPIFKDMEHVEVIVPGDAKDVVVHRVSDLDRRRWPQQYQMFKQGQSEQLIGTPLSEVTWIPRSQVEELKYFKIMTVEQLAQVNDSACSKIPGLHDLKRRAAAFVDSATAAAPLLALEESNKVLENEVATLKNSLQEAIATIKELKAKVKD
jgi:hypothetical protein